MAYAEEIKEEGLVEKLVQVNRSQKLLKEAEFWLYCFDSGRRREWKGRVWPR